jgi:hypothetical protein
MKRLPEEVLQGVGLVGGGGADEAEGSSEMTRHSPTRNNVRVRPEGSVLAAAVTCSALQWFAVK